MSSIEKFPAAAPEGYIAVALDNPGDGLSDKIVLELPVSLDIDEAAQRWAQCGGQIRYFGETVDLKQLDFVSWLIKQEGARYPQAEPA